MLEGAGGSARDVAAEERPPSGDGAASGHLPAHARGHTRGARREREGGRAECCARALEAPAATSHFEPIIYGSPVSSMRRVLRCSSRTMQTDKQSAAPRRRGSLAAREQAAGSEVHGKDRKGSTHATQTQKRRAGQLTGGLPRALLLVGVVSFISDHHLKEEEKLNT